MNESEFMLLMTNMGCIIQNKLKQQFFKYVKYYVNILLFITILIIFTGSMFTYQQLKINNLEKIIKEHSLVLQNYNNLNFKK